MTLLIAIGIFFTFATILSGIMLSLLHWLDHTYTLSVFVIRRSLALGYLAILLFSLVVAWLWYHGSL